MDVFVILVVVFSCFFIFYQIGKSVGIKETTLNLFKEAKAKEEVKRNEYLSKMGRLNEELPKLKTVRNFSADFSSQLLSGKLSNANKDSKTKQTPIKRDTYKS